MKFWAAVIFLALFVLPGNGEVWAKQGHPNKKVFRMVRSQLWSYGIRAPFFAGQVDYVNQILSDDATRERRRVIPEELFLILDDEDFRFRAM